MGIAVRVSDLTKVYQRYAHRKQFRTLKSALLKGNLIGELRPDEIFSALSGVTFNVWEGSTFAVIGRNGSGKSSLLKVLAGITKPTSGEVEVNGRVSALIELGAGFHPEISGRENVFINGIMLGLSKREITERFDEIVEFAELEEFIDAPVKNYSSGMYMRLGFAVAIHVNPDVLLIDEVLAVGDQEFVHKCLDKISEFRRRGKTILLVTHSLGLVEKLADEAIWLDGGKIQVRGDPKKVVDAYLAQVTSREEEALAAAEEQAVAAFSGSPEAEPAPDEESPSQREKGRWGSREVEITEAALLGSDGEPRHVFDTGEPVTVRLRIKSSGTIKDFVFGIGIFNADGVCCYGTNTDIEEFVPLSLSGDGEVRFALDRLDLVEGTYFLDVAAHQRDGYPFDYHRSLHAFRVNSRVKDLGIYRPAHRWEFSSNISIKPPSEQ
ncbi:MAG TPA: ABC transporter ATP-binding protein [Vicinamibacteria bacterium]|jgi:ABC-type polysaccharide/polyol phosphate transport system ATPase subunit